MKNELPLRNPNHPKKGSSTKVLPIKDLMAIQHIKSDLSDRPRDLCLFSLGINTAYRANELLSITIGQVNYLDAGDVLALNQSKTGRKRSTTLNSAAITAINQWLQHHPRRFPDEPLFPSKKGGALTVPTMVAMVKEWCCKAGLRGNYGSHTLRKTWGYHQLRSNQTTSPQMVLPILMEAYGHARQQQTLEYLCIQSDEVANLFMAMEL